MSKTEKNIYKKEYKVIIAEIYNLYRDMGNDFQDQLNSFARNGYRFVCFIPQDNELENPRVLLEKDLTEEELVGKVEE